MNFIARIANGLAPSKRSFAGTPSSGMTTPFGSMPSNAGVNISQVTAMTVSSVYCAVSTLSTDVARCTPALYRTSDDGSREKLKRKDHPVASLLRKPNRVQTWFEFCRDMQAALELRGNAYAAVLRDRRGNPVELIYINPDCVTVLEAANGDVFYQVSRIGLFMMAMLRDMDTTIPAEDMLHLRGWSLNMLVAASTIGLARETIGVAMAQAQQQSRWVGNGAKPSGVLMTDKPMSNEAAKQLKSDWNSITQGVLNTGSTPVLEGGVKFLPLQLTGADMQFIEQANFTVQDVARFFGMPLRKLSQPDQSRGSTILQEEQAYVNASVAPRLLAWEEKFADFFGLDDQNLELDLDDDALLRADPQTRYNLGRIGKLSGLITTAEWRRAERLPFIPGTDALTSPVNMATLGSDLTGTAPDGAGRPKDNHLPAPGVPTGNDEAPEG